MASAQVLSTSRKQEHLEAGKRRLEEFRKKKAAERAKKSTSVSQSQASDVSLHDKQGLEADRMRVTDSDGVGTSDRPDKAVTGTTLVLNNDDSKLTELSTQNQQGLLNDRHANPFSSVNDLNSSSIDLAQAYSNNQAIKIHGASGPVEQVGASNNLETKDVNNDFVHSRGQDRPQYGSMSDQLFGLRPQASQDYDSGSSKSSFQGIEEPRLTENDSFFKVSAVHSDSSNEFVTQISPQNSITTPLQSKPRTAGILGSGRTFYSSSKDSTQPTTSARGSVLEVGKNMQGVANSSVSVVSDSDETKLSNSASGFPSLYNGPVQTSKSSGFSFDVTSSYNHVPMHSAANEFTSRRSRPSFLDSLDIPRASSGSPFQRTEPPKESFMSNSSDLNRMDVLGSSAAQKPLAETGTVEPFSTSITSNAPSAFNDVGNFSVSVNNGADLLRPGTNENSKEMKHVFYSTKQNEDFAALEQHIEDLTQEKFSLQRSLEASQALAQSLAAENSSLTDNYNQQRSVVNQLKSDMEKLQEEIKAQLVELESFRDEYANARLECSAADERAKILASEVIGLEEKALRLRSSELKLERQLENSQAEISSYKKKVSSIEKERKDLQLTIDALQEEKKVLQSKVRKASGSMQSTEMNKNPTTSRKDMSTSTEDLDTTLDNKEVHDNSSSLESDASGLPLLSGNGLLALDVSAVNIPPDQMRMIQNINALISELSLEKEELIQALSSELSQSSKLKDLNNELSRKLEAQTQRLELLTAQNMVTEHVSTRQSDSRVVHDNVAYADADEGDEVVERVLGWIMKLFPGGPSRRRTSKLL